MEMSEREYHIKVLENLLSHYKTRKQCEGYYDSTLKDNVEALEYAISSIKTDEAYQIMYEGGEIFTKADMVALLEEIDNEFDKQYYINRHELHDDFLNRGLEQGQNIIQQKINALKGEQVEHNN